MTKRIPTGEPEPLVHRPFSNLAGTSQSPPLAAAPEPARPPSDGPSEAPAWAVVRLERKGRGGKEVTVVDKLDLKPRLLELWAKALKHELGCGGAVEGRGIVLQGDQRERVVAWLVSRGVRKVTRG